jgi:hypothetical protein
MSAIDRIKQTIAESIMQRNGWTEQTKTENPIEWDLSRNDSQYSMVVEETNYVIDAFLQELADTTEDTQEEDIEEESMFDEYGHIKRDEPVTTSGVVFIFMDAGTGNPRYVSDVREWLARVDRLGVPNDTEIEGTLHLSFDIDDPYTERIECGGCGTKDILLTVHSCEETPC